MEPILEGGGDAEIAAAATQSPEEVGVLVRTSRQHVALGCNQVNRQQVIAGEAVLTHEKAMAATERQASDAGRAGYPAGSCQTKGLRLMIEVSPGDPTLGADCLAHRINPHAPHTRQVYHQAAVANRKTRHAVAAAADGD